MYTLMIFDDHQYVIDAICETINQSNLDLEFIGCAQNAADGLEKIFLQKPDIVITDINMPGMSGLEMIENATTKGINTKFILISGYSNFEYAQKAMSYGVTSYLLKPVLPEDILKALKQAVAICDEESSNINLKKMFDESMPVLRKSFISDLLSGSNMTLSEFNEKADLFGIDIKDKLYRCITVNIDNYSNFKERFHEDERQCIKLDILAKIAKYLSIDNTFVNFSDNQAHILLYNDKNEINKYDDSSLVDIFSEIIAIISNCYNVALSFGIGNTVDKYADIHESYIQSAEVFKYTFCLSPESITFYNDIINTQVIQPVVNLYNRSELTDSLKMHSITGIKHCFENMMNTLKANKFISSDYIRIIVCEMYYTIYATLYNMGETEICTHFKEKNYINQIENAKDHSALENILNSIADTLKNSIDNKSSQRTSRIIEQIIEYIENNYQDDISLETLSKHIFLTPNYLSRIFIAHTNTSFIKYLTGYRIEKAKEFLLSGEYKVYDVCSMVGYKNPTYFRKIFKEYVGKSPSAFLNE